MSKIIFAKHIESIELNSRDCFYKGENLQPMCIIYLCSGIKYVIDNIGDMGDVMRYCIIEKKLGIYKKYSISDFMILL